MPAKRTLAQAAETINASLGAAFSAPASPQASLLDGADDWKFDVTGFVSVGEHDFTDPDDFVPVEFHCDHGTYFTCEIYPPRKETWTKCSDKALRQRVKEALDDLEAGSDFSCRNCDHPLCCDRASHS